MASNFQDDDRENLMRELFGLIKDEGEGRSGIDAYLNLDDQMIPFELKTTSTGSVTTVRDFGADHIRKWEGKHWLIGFHINDRVHYKYGSPTKMAPWIQGKWKYVKPDYIIANLAPSYLALEDLYQILEQKTVYTYEDARTIQKNQYKKEKYLELQDLTDGYSPERMLDIVKDRAKYLIERGSTLNNPHIPHNYFDDCPEITENHSEQLKNMVRNFLGLDD